MKRGVLLGATAFILATIGFGASALAEGVHSTCAESSVFCDDAAKARKIDDPATLVLNWDLGVEVDELRCSCRAENRARPDNGGQRGVGFDLDVSYLSSAGSVVGQASQRAKTANSGYRSFKFDVPDAAAGAAVGIDLFGAKKANKGGCKCWADDVPPCESDETTLCVRKERFQVVVDWEDPSGRLGSGRGMVSSSTSDSGDFYFVNPSFPDLLVQLIDRCSFNDHFWVFASATTSVEYDVTVTDTLTGEVKTYSDGLLGPAQAVTDTSAFATCP